MLIDLLSNTPLYVYWIFFSFIFVGYSQSKRRQVGLKRAVGIPFVLILVSIYAIVHDFGLNFYSLSVWVSGIVLVLALDKIVKSQKDVEYSHLNKVFIIGGSYLPLFMLMLLFFTKYSVGVLRTIDSPFIHTSLFIITASFLYGIFSGMYLIRFFVLINKMKN